jgi:hypothetical protein
VANQELVRRIALALPGAEESDRDFAFHVFAKGKPHGFAWVWKERVDPKKSRVPNPDVLAVRVANLGHREALLIAEPKKFFTEPHYNGFPAVLVRLKAVRASDLRVLLREAWECVGGGSDAAPRKTAKQKARRR